VAQLNDGRIEGRSVLSATALTETRRRQADQDRAFGEIRRFGWGLGWDLGRLDGELLVHRFGGFPGYRSHLSFMPERRLGVAVLVNENQLGGRLADLVAGYAYELLLDRAGVGARYEGKLQALRDEAGKAREKMAQEAAARAARPQQLPHPLEAYAGVYESRRLGRLELRVVGGRLEARMGVLSSPVEIFDGAKNALRVELTGSGSVLEAAFPADGGSASRLTFEGERFDRAAPQGP
jgi:hypothetical protein